MADQYDQTISFTDLPLSIQRNIQQELKDELKLRNQGSIPLQNKRKIKLAKIHL